jgi:Heliorhodopsin
MAVKKSTKRSVNNDRRKSLIDFNSLGLWNKWLAIIFALQAVAIVVAGASKLYPITTNYLGIDTLQTQAQGHTVYATGSQVLFDVNLTYMVAAFLIIAAIGHFLMVTKLRMLYEKDIEKGTNRVRWVSFGATAGVMALAVGLVIGLQDISSLIMFFGLTILACLFGLLVETRNSEPDRQRWLSYSIAGVNGVLPWIIIAIYLISGAVYGSIPAFVWWVSGIVFVAFVGILMNLIAQHRKLGKWADNKLYGERLFMVGGLLSTSALAWLIFIGVLHP